MSNALTDATDYFWRNIESSLIPVADDASWEDCGYAVASQTTLFALNIIPAIALRVINGAVCLTKKVITLPWQETADPNRDFSVVCEDSREWERVTDRETRLLPADPNRDFRFGISACDYQYTPPSMNPDSQWTRWINERLGPEIRPTVSVDFWNRVDEMVDKIERTGVKEFRFSLEWSRIQPREGVFVEEEIQRVRRLCTKLHARGIEPMMTIMHFTHPQWLEDKGGFENPEAIGYFLNFSEHVFRKLSDVCSKWCTINEPGVVTFMGYVMGEYPPGKFLAFQRCGRVLKNLLLAHVKVHEKLKSMERARECEIGITHQCLKFCPYSKWNPIERAIASQLSKVTHEAVMHFFETGEFKFQIPFVANVTHKITEARARGSLDFFGLQYYVRPLVSLIGRSTYPGEAMTSMPFREDPAGIYELLKEVNSRIRKPIVITETGIPTHSDIQRRRYYERVCYAVSRAIEDGVDVHGMHMWSLTRNIEWHEGMHDKAGRGPDFGIYDLDRQGGTLSLRPSSQAYIRHARSYNARRQTGAA